LYIVRNLVAVLKDKRVSDFNRYRVERELLICLINIDLGSLCCRRKKQGYQNNWQKNLHSQRFPLDESNINPATQQNLLRRSFYQATDYQMVNKPNHHHLSA